MSYKKNVAGQFFYVQGVDAATGGIKSGVSWTVRRCIDGTFANATGTATEDGTTGWYKFAMSQADTNGNDIGFNFTGTGAVPQTVNILTDGAPSDVNLTQIDGQATNGNNATLNLKQLNIVNDSGDAIHAEATGGNGHGISAKGYNSGAGIRADGNSVGPGAAFAIIGGNGPGIQVYAANSDAVTLYGGNGVGLGIFGTGDGISAIDLTTDPAGGTQGKCINAPFGIAVQDGDLTLANINAQVADVLRTDIISDSIPTTGSLPTLEQAIYTIHQFLMEKSVSSTTLTVNKADGATSLLTFTLDSATDPTSITRAT